MRKFEDSFDHLRQVSDRVRRLYACACYAFVKEKAKSKQSDRAVAFAITNIDNWWDDAVRTNLRYYRKGAKDTLAALHSADEGAKRYQREIARELALWTVEEHIQTRKLVSVIWGARGFVGQRFDHDILECLDVIGPTTPRRGLAITFQMSSHIQGLAQAVYEGDDDLRGVLADAVEDAGGCGEWIDHLRSPKRHWKGCWVIDTLLGKG